ncbi:MAG: class I SAM-dependent methyltransferase [Methanocellales archaeon]
MLEQKLAWEQEHIKANWRGPFSIQPILKYLDRDRYILDAGCGRGRYLYPLARRGYKIIGCDFAFSALKELKQRGMEIAACEISKLPFKSNIFQAVLCYGVLQHLLKKGRELAIAEIHRVIKPGGRLFLEVLGREDMRYGKGEMVEKDTFQRKSGLIYHYFSSQELIELLRDFEIIQIEDKKIEKTFKGEKYTRHFIFVIASLPQ